MNRQETNAQRLANLSPVIRRKVEAVLSELEGAEFQPLIVSALRSAKEQALKVQLGYSKTLRSKHLPGVDGLSNAADIVDIRWGYNTKAHPAECHSFFLMLGHCAILHGMGWGGMFGLQWAEKVRLRTFLVADGPWSDHRASQWQARIGWDPSHIERLG